MRIYNLLLGSPRTIPGMYLERPLLLPRWYK
jgi:hypothetical protein